MIIVVKYLLLLLLVAFINLSLSKTIYNSVVYNSVVLEKIHKKGR